MKNQDTYKEVVAYQTERATIRVHIPDITEEERNKRLERVKLSAENLLKEVVKNEHRTLASNG